MPVVAVIGASSDRVKYGNKAVRAYRRQGWTVYPINRQEKEIEGLPAYRSIEEVPGAVDRFSLYVPPAVGMTLLGAIAGAIAAHGPAELWVNPGAESDALLAEAERLGLNPIQACSIVDIGERP